MLTLQYVLLTACIGSLVYLLLHTNTFKSVIALVVAMLLFMGGMDVKAYRDQTNICTAMSSAGVISPSYNSSCGITIGVTEFIVTHTETFANNKRTASL